MFQNWGFLISEIWLLLILAALVGLLAGFIMWGRAAATVAVAGEGPSADDLAKANETIARLRHERDEAAQRLEGCRSDGEKKDARLKEMELELDALRGEAAFTAPLPAFEAEDDELRAFDETSGKPKAPADVLNASAPAAQDAIDPAVGEQTPDYDGDGKLEGADEGEKPALFDGPREGGGDDLKMIKGIGTKLEAKLHEMGVYHFDQIANWSADEVAWVNANLVGFKGRVTRDNWVEQAALLATGGETDFSKRVSKGGLYDE
ncbi:hypothetical protein [Vannielia sp.]|uniref:hypothetical protein n=1 Tax=Vannielia sp. TaxID=2813045 RepID=UPI002611CEBC|nr:hypothetical protein [Vannielia sp.]MDF1873692.1 hypothetical protein [Vannielia sp.]